MPRWGRGGVGGFTEELPAMLVVLVAVSLFVASLATAHSSFVERERWLDRRESVSSVLGLLWSDQELTEGHAGMYDAMTLADENSTSYVVSILSPAVLGFQYRLEITSLDGKDLNFTVETGQRPTGKPTVVESSPCNILVGQGHVEPGLVRITAWGFVR
jgi:hypothetical protein